MQARLFGGKSRGKTLQVFSDYSNALPHEAVLRNPVDDAKAFLYVNYVIKPPAFDFEFRGKPFEVDDVLV